MLIRTSLLNSVSSIAFATPERPGGPGPGDTTGGNKTPPGGSPDLGEEIEEQAEELAEEVAKLSALGSRTAAAAAKYGEQTLTDAEFNDEVDANVKAKEISKQGPAKMLLTLQRIFGEALLAFPVPGSKPPENYEGNELFDRYSTKVRVGGEMKTRPGSFYSDLVYSTKKGKEIRVELDAVNSKPDKSAENTAEKGRLNQAFQAERTLITKAVRMAHQTAMINQILPHIVVDLFWKEGLDPESVGDGVAPVLMNTPNIVVLQAMNPTTGRPGPRSSLTVDSFLSLKPLKAKEDGGKLSDLLATTGKKKKPASTGDDKYPVPQSSADIEGWAAAGAHAFGNAKTFEVITLAVEKPGADDLAMSMGELYFHFDAYWAAGGRVAFEKAKHKARQKAEAKHDAEKAQGQRKVG